MDRPKGISSGEAMRWNADVEQRRRAYHERRCAEDPIYKRVYDRQQEMMQRIQKMTGVTFAQLQNAIGEVENTKCQQLTDQLNVGDELQAVKTEEEMRRERATLVDIVSRRFNKHHGGIACLGLGFILSAMTLSDYEKLKQRLKDLEEERSYTEEIRKADAKFDNELIRLNGFAW